MRIEKMLGRDDWFPIYAAASGQPVSLPNIPISILAAVALGVSYFLLGSVGVILCLIAMSLLFVVYKIAMRQDRRDEQAARERIFRQHTADWEKEVRERKAASVH